MLNNKRETAQEVPVQEQSKKIVSKIGNTTLEITASNITCNVSENPSHNKEYCVLKVGKLTNEELSRFNLGPYSKISTPGSVSV